MRHGKPPDARQDMGKHSVQNAEVQQPQDEPRRPNVVRPRQGQSSVGRDPKIHGGTQEDLVDDEGPAQANHLVQHKVSESLSVQAPRAEESRDQEEGAHKVSLIACLEKSCKDGEGRQLLRPLVLIGVITQRAYAASTRVGPLTHTVVSDDDEGEEGEG